jgi:hypothetical protein
MTELRKQQLRTPETLKVLGAKFPKAWTVWVDGVEHLALVALETIAPGDERWHISVSTEDAVPHWNAMAAIAHDLRPGVVFCIGAPPRSWWINIAEHCLHLWELRDPHLIAQWRFERRGDSPS